MLIFIKSPLPFTNHQSPTISMPAIRSISSASNAALCEQYERNLNQSRVHYNTNGCQYARGVGYTPYPELEDVFIRSNGVDVSEESFEELGLSDYIIVQQRIGRNRFDQWRNVMNAHQRDVLFRGLEPWDKDEEYSKVLEASLVYLSAIGVMLFEQQYLTEDQVSICYVVVLLRC